MERARLASPPPPAPPSKFANSLVAVAAACRSLILLCCPNKSDPRSHERGVTSRNPWPRLFGQQSTPTDDDASHSLVPPKPPRRVQCGWRWVYRPSKTFRP